MILVMMPPLVSMPMDSGVTSSSRTSLTSPLSTPACRLAPTATTSSGLTPLFGSLPPVSSLTSVDDGGHAGRATDQHDVVDLPTPRCPASRITDWNGVLVRSSRSAVSRWNCARVSFSSRCSGPASDAVMYGRLIVVSDEEDSSILAFSAASRSRCIAIRSLDRSTPWPFLNFLTSQSTTCWSQSSPPRWLSPQVALTSTTPSPISSRDTSNVPPPRSNTRMVWSVSPLSRPYASAAAVGSLTMRRTLSPAISPASLVAWRWASSK